MSKITVKDILKEFNFTVANDVEVDLDRVIVNPSIHRLGLELAGVRNLSSAKTIIGWGTKEDRFLADKDPLFIEDILNLIINEDTPFIILSAGISQPIFEQILIVANKKRTPVIKTEFHLAVVHSTVGTYLVEALAPSQVIHASLVIVNGVGVAIVGKSGIGKSEAVLELIQNGHSFVSDDSVQVKHIGNKFLGFPVHLTKGFLEARGIGLINIPYIYGARVVKDWTQIELVVELIAFKEGDSFDRLGNLSLTYKVLDSQIPKIQIPVTQGRLVSSLIETAVNVFLARKAGMDSLKIIGERRDSDEFTK